MADADRPDVSLVVPVYNEVDNLRPLQLAISAAMEGHNYEVVLVNDGSDDGSDAILDALAEAHDEVRVIHFVRNYGQTAALTAGIRHAQAPIIVTLDADLQNDPEDIPSMLAKLDEADVVCGWDQDRKDPFLSRTLPSKIANVLISKFSNVPLHDYGCTLRAYKREYLEQIPLYGEMHRFIPIYVTWAGAKLIEVPVRHHPRTRGKSKYGISRVFKVLLDLTTVKFLRDFFVTPIYFFGWLGFFLFASGIAAGCAAIAFWTVLDNELLAACLTVISPMLAIFGVVEITLGIIAEVLIRMHYEIQGRAPYRISRALGVEPASEER